MPEIYGFDCYSPDEIAEHVVTLGNLAGGAGMVGLVYWTIYRRPRKRANSSAG